MKREMEATKEIELPEDLWRLFLTKMNMRERMRFSSTSKRFYVLAMESVTSFSSYHFKNFPSIVKLANLEELVLGFNSSRIITLETIMSLKKLHTIGLCEKYNSNQDLAKQLTHLQFL